MTGLISTGIKVQAELVLDVDRMGKTYREVYRSEDNMWWCKEGNKWVSVHHSGIDELNALLLSGKSNQPANAGGAK